MYLYIFWGWGRADGSGGKEEEEGGGENSGVEGLGGGGFEKTHLNGGIVYITPTE